MKEGQIAREGIRVYGIVQGIGFRPFVSRLAEELEIRGTVCNRGSYVEIHGEGTEKALTEFRRRLERDAPEVGRIVCVEHWEEEVLRETEFRIVGSEKDAGAIFVSPDLAICPDCERELFDPGNRRYLHPFINCTNCGPRLTILDGMPYDRERTSMEPFPMCASCAEEYGSPRSRRYHAQPVCCAEDGPRLSVIWRPAAEEFADLQEAHSFDAVRSLDTVGPHRESDGAAIRLVREVIRRGGIVAIRGIGGFHLACDAGNPLAVRKLRERKRRPMKPFAVMTRDLETVQMICEISEDEERILTGMERPILLLKRKSDSGNLAAEVAPKNPDVGVLLPYAPVHHLLFRYPDGQTFPDVLVMTSGNPSGAPICRTTEEAEKYLFPLADLILTHDRDIRLRADDSVLSVVEGRPYMIRRSRGYAPLPFVVPSAESVGRARSRSVTFSEGRGPGESIASSAERNPAVGGSSSREHCVLAVGGELKNTFCIAKGDLYDPSPYIGDMADLRSVEALRSAVERMETLLEAAPEAVVCDLHPRYNTVKLAKELGLPVLRVQHHYAHVLSCMAEHMRAESVIGVAFDGTGYGTDGTIWGGEFLVASPREFERVGSLRPFRQCGGDAAAREGWRIAVSLMEECGDPLSHLCTDEEYQVLLNMLKANINTVLSTSAGRLFDAASAILGIRRISTFEGEAAMALEFAADPRAASLAPMPVAASDEKRFEIDTHPLIRALIEGVRQNRPAAELAGGFHSSVADGIVNGCEKCRELTGLSTVILTGGVFQNRKLLAMAKERLEQRGFEVLTHSLIPPNDGGIALGQVYYGMWNW